MRDRIGPYLFPWLPLFLVAAVWMHGNAARLNAAEDQVYSGSLPSMVTFLLSRQAKDADGEEHARDDPTKVISASGLLSDQRGLFDGE